ncbi:MAG: hypothetical protein OXG85_14475 [Chloroflexi bacterium]|nr:hypothetical protein [Chloroflexota bacterium]
MSRIRLEWDVESQRIDGSSRESAAEKRRRRRAALALLALVLLLAASIALGLLFLRQRLLEIERQFAQLLQDTVKAEMAALRIGDLNSFLNIQNTEDANWLAGQQALFQQYGVLKSAGDIDLPGNILDVTIDRDRARVLVQENIKDLPYVRLWFYRRSDEGWRHVAQDLSFWGEGHSLESSALVVRYRDADELFARQVTDALSAWLENGCEILECAGLPPLSVDIAAEAAHEAAWLDQANMRLLIRSPYLDIARADYPFDGWRQLLVSKLLAERLVDAHTGYLKLSPFHDSHFLRASAIAWLSETFTRLDGGATLMRSLAANYGADKIARLLSALTDSGDLSLVEQGINLSLGEADLDWRDFVLWRLNLEAQLMTARRQDEWLSLYDTADESARLTAYERYRLNAPPTEVQVVDASVAIGSDGSARLRASVQAAGDASAEIVLFNLVGGVWKRAN